MEVTNAQTYSLRADEVKAVERDDDELAYLWFAENAPGQVRYLTVTKSYVDDEIYLERDDQKWCCYGGVKEVSFDGERLEVRVDDEAAKGLGGYDRLAVDCPHLDRVHRQKIARVLTAIFGESDVSLSFDAA